MDEVLTRFFSIGLILFIVPLIMPLLMEKSTMPGEYIVKYKPVVGFIGGIELLTFGIAIAAILLTEGFSPIIFLLLPLIAGGVYLLLKTIFWRIYFEDSGFVLKNCFGRKRRYAYSEITKIIDRDPEKYSLYLGKKKITVEYPSINAEVFLKRIMRENAKKNLNIEIIYKQKKRKY